MDHLTIKQIVEGIEAQQPLHISDLRKIAIALGATGGLDKDNDGQLIAYFGVKEDAFGNLTELN